MRTKVYFNVLDQLRPAPLNLDDQFESRVQSQIHNFEETVTTANAKGLVTQWALKVTRKALERKFHELLLENGVGTLEMEVQAIKVSRATGIEYNRLRKSNKNQEVKRRLIKEFRTPDRVKDVVGIRLKVCREEEERMRKIYKELKNVAKIVFENKNYKLKRIL